MTPQMKEKCNRHHKVLVVTGGHTDKETEMFPVMLAVCVSDEAAMQKAVSETNGRTQKLICEEMHLSRRLVFLMGGLFGNLTVVSSRMELNFEPNSSVLSCARVRGEKNRQKNAEER